MTTPDPGGGKSPGPMRYAGLGIQLAVSLVVFVLRRASGPTGSSAPAGSSPSLAAFLGFGGTMYSLIRTLNKKDGGGE